MDYTETASLPEEENKMSFEDALSELENIIKRLDEGKDGLQESVTHYKYALKLAQHCQKLLDDAKLDIKKVTESVGGTISLETVKD